MNTRTQGTLTKEDLEQCSRTQEFSGEGGSELSMMPMVAGGSFNFADDDDMVFPNQAEEGDSKKPVACSNPNTQTLRIIPC